MFRAWGKARVMLKSKLLYKCGMKHRLCMPPCSKTEHFVQLYCR